MSIKERGYQFEKPKQNIKISPLRQISEVIRDMRSNALFLSIHAIDEQSRKENEIVEQTLRSVMDVIKHKTN